MSYPHKSLASNNMIELDDKFSSTHLWELNYDGALGNTLLHLGAKISDYELVTLLLNRGADVTSMDTCGRTALHIACEKGSLEIMKLLAEKSPAYILDLPSDFGHTPLNEACRCNSPEVVQLLLSHGSSVDINDVQRYGPLLNAVSNVAEYATPIASLLLDAGSNLH
ncbi:putative ankyrin repeat protein RF_0381 [Stegodyphus dumicola]|uniref:putative ankyrin repeat protein RF_0381 n=1 Tax=Stegodyphus dumicola TaxID=202533 RepID=UPI0015ABC0D2|nr:putative ankyrin repeat protein RF_0381 [Stegodyphus dumicola]